MRIRLFSRSIMKSSFGGPAWFVMLAFVLQACVGLQPLPSAFTLDANNCARFFRELDAQIDAHNVADAAAARIDGFPMLRVDRFLASFAQQELNGDAQAAWLERLRRLDENARLNEWQNLPLDAQAEFQNWLGVDVEATVGSCGRLLTKQAEQSASEFSRLQSASEAPDAYATWQRTLGLYYLTRWAIVGAVWQLHRELRAPFLKSYDAQPAEGRLMRFAPAAAEFIRTDEVATILQQSAKNPLRIPEPGDKELQRLFAAYAPVWVIDTASASDAVGTIKINASGEAYVDTQQPTVYRLPSYTRYGDQILLQLNYLIWFPARPPANALDIYAGRFDGVIWRVTLNRDGTPLAYDSIHPCGCYYQIFPGEGLKVIQPGDGSEPILSPTPILAELPEKRLAVRISAGHHYINGVSVDEPAAVRQSYAWLDYDLLRSLPLPDGQRQGLFDADGLLPASERLERFLLWPMGVPSAGAMRQWGTHAIAFLGKRHFDDPYLIEKLVKPLWDAGGEDGAKNRH